MSGDNSGSIVIIYRINNGEFEYLLPTQKSGMTNFVGGGKEAEDRTHENTIRREIAEETNLGGGDYSIRQTDIVHKFVYSGNKPNRAGQKWENKVFIAQVNSDMEIKPSSEIETLNWYSENQALESLAFDDMKEVFTQAVEMIKRKHE